MYNFILKCAAWPQATIAKQTFFIYTHTANKQTLNVLLNILAQPVDMVGYCSSFVSLVVCKHACVSSNPHCLSR